MGIFNTKIFDELKEGFKNLSKRIKENLDADKEESVSINRCPACGAPLNMQSNSDSKKCQYCGSEIKI